MRQIEAKMVEYLDFKLERNGSAQDAILKKHPRKLLIHAAQSLVGIREEGGNNHGPMVELMQETIGRGGDGSAWCASLTQTCIAYAEIKTGITSPIYPSEHCLTVWNKTDLNCRVMVSPLPGAIAIWQHGSSSNGHTGILTEVNHSGHFEAVEGNTTHGLNDDGKIIRDGGGVYQTYRSMRGDGDMRLLGFLKPFDYIT